ncbi:MAG: DMT family transporter [Actinomycetes bacterium]
MHPDSPPSTDTDAAVTDAPAGPSRAALLGAMSLAVVAVSSSAILARYAMGPSPQVVAGADGTASALAVAFWRTLAGAVALAPLAWRDRRRGHVTDAATHRLLGWSGLWLGLHFLLFQGSLALTTVASSVTLATMSPIFVALGGWWLLGERTSRRTWGGMWVTVAGALVIGLADAGAIDLGPRALVGDAMAFGSAIAVTGYLLIGRRVRPHVPAATYSCLVYAWAALSLAPVVVALGVPLTGYSTATWLALAGIVIGPQLLGHTVFNTLLSDVSATIVAIVILAEPVVATLMALVLLDEVPASLFWLGAPLVLIGVAISATRAGARDTSAAAAEAGADL